MEHLNYTREEVIMGKLAAFFMSGVLCVLFFAGCSKDNGNNPQPLTYGVISGRIIDPLISSLQNAGIASANVIVYNASTNAPVTRTLSDNQGYYRIEVAAGTYYLNVAAQGFKPFPDANAAPLPFNAAINDTVIKDVNLTEDPAAASTGSISGTVVLGTSGVVNVLIVATRSTDSLALSTVSGPAGFFAIYNIPAGTYALRCYAAGYGQVSDTLITVSANTALTGINLHVVAVTNVRLTGKITFLASPNSQVDITLVNPLTREAIPGLDTINDANLNYSLSGIPPGTYIAWASYRNDGYVMDPDWIRKFGLPVVTFSATDTLKTLNFSVTGAITIISPTNPADSVYPVTVSTTTPTFSWMKYPAAHEYIIEVFNSSGDRIWGGYDTNGTVLLNTQITQQDTSVVFNFDGSALDSLHNGESYRWKIYADNSATPGVQGLISASEDLRGLFKVVLP